MIRCSTVKEAFRRSAIVVSRLPPLEPPVESRSNLHPGHEQRVKAHADRVEADLARIERLDPAAREAKYRLALAREETREEARRRRHREEYLLLDDAAKAARRDRDRARRRAGPQNARRRELYRARREGGAA